MGGGKLDILYFDPPSRVCLADIVELTPHTPTSGRLPRSKMNWTLQS